MMAAMPSRWFLFAHGAGAPSSSAWMKAWGERLSAMGEVTAFDYPYMRAGRKTPDKLPALMEAHKQALAEVRARARGGPIFLAGKSMGGRVGCHVALEEPVTGLICLGYPLVAGGSGALRDEVLLALRTPVLFVQGTRDSLCPIPRLEEVRAKMTAPNRLHLIEGGNHSLELPAQKKNAAAQKDVTLSAVDAIRRFVEELAP
jgi:predicted alpha/beta-hydrolase family hydrolase